MATIIQQALINRPPDEIWAAIEDVGAAHTALAPGFVIATDYCDGVRQVTFASGATLEEPIVTIDGTLRRLVWTARGGITTHYNAAMQVYDEIERSHLVWTADFLPDSAAPVIAGAMQSGLAAIKAHLERTPELR